MGAPRGNRNAAGRRKIYHIGISKKTKTAFESANKRGSIKIVRNTYNSASSHRNVYRKIRSRIESKYLKSKYKV